MTVSRDTYIARTLELVGWRTIPAASDERYPTVELPRDGAETDLVLLPSEPYRFRAKHVPELQALLPHAQVSLVDGEATSWYGSRAIAGIRCRRRARRRARAQAGMIVPRFMIPFGSKAAFSASSIA